MIHVNRQWVPSFRLNDDALYPISNSTVIIARERNLMSAALKVATNDLVTQQEDTNIRSRLTTTSR